MKLIQRLLTLSMQPPPLRPLPPSDHHVVPYDPSFSSPTGGRMWHHWHSAACGISRPGCEQQLVRVDWMQPQLPTVRPSRLVTDGERHLLLLAKSCGTVFWMTLHLLHHWQCIGKNWKHIYFGSHIRTLFCSLFAAVLAMVVLVVTYSVYTFFIRFRYQQF